MGSGELDAGKLQRRFGHMDHQEHTVTGETAFTFVQDPYFFQVPPYLDSILVFAAYILMMVGCCLYSFLF
jgi:hypothetical protein